MGATLQELLPRNTGRRLPARVLEALDDMAVACNEAALAVNQAIALVEQTTNRREVRQVLEPGSAALRTIVVTDLERVAESFHAQTVVVLARAAAVYAVYASRVAEAAVAALPVPLPGSDMVKPSEVIADLGRHLPLVRFPASSTDLSVTQEQNESIGAAYRLLEQVIAQQLFGQDASVYDDPAVVASNAYDSVGLSVTFADVLHSYAANVIWAMGMFAGQDDAG